METAAVVTTFAVRALGAAALASVAVLFLLVGFSAILRERRLAAEARRLEASRCAICGLPTTSPTSADEPARWAEHLHANIHVNCIPSLVRSRGAVAVNFWLATGLVSAGPHTTLDIQLLSSPRGSA